MNKLYRVLVLCASIIALSGCQKGNIVGARYNASNLILGKWSLQKQKTVIYVNGAIQLDTICVTSFTNVSHASFNKDNTFNSVGLWSGMTVANTNLGGNNTVVAGMDSTAGTYTIVNSNLNITAPLAGLRNMVGFYNAASSSAAVSQASINVISRSSQITLLTSSQFNLHYELVYNVIINDASSSFKEEEDYYYSR